MTIVPKVRELQVDILQVPPQAASITYFITISQGSIAILNATTNNISTFQDLTPNTNYTITVMVTNCPGISAVVTTKCTRKAKDVDLTR